MRDRFVKLHPVDADHTATAVDDVIVDSEKTRTLFFEYPSDDVSDDRVLPTLTSTPSTERPLPTRYQVSSVLALTSNTVFLQIIRNEITETRYIQRRHFDAIVIRHTCLRCILEHAAH